MSIRNWKCEDPKQQLVWAAATGEALRVLEGKWKMSQNRPEADRLGVAAGLVADAPADPQALAHAALVRAVRQPR